MLLKLGHDLFLRHNLQLIIPRSCDVVSDVGPSAGLSKRLESTGAGQLVLFESDMSVVPLETTRVSDFCFL
jgi:hypothetical protein